MNQYHPPQPYHQKGEVKTMTPNKILSNRKGEIKITNDTQN